MMLSRRSALGLIAGAPLLLTPGRLCAAKAAEFWNSEDPSEWSTEEIQRLTTDSPWAKPVTAEIRAYAPQSANGNGGRRGSGRTGRTSGTQNPAAGAPRFPGVVRWVSAKPLLLASKTQLPADFAHNYVIGVAGLPVISGHGEGADNTDSYAGLKETTLLQVKGQVPVSPGTIEADPNDTSTLLFGFLNQLLDLSKGKSATFSTSMGPLNVKAKFDLTRMIFKGELAV